MENIREEVRELQLGMKVRRLRQKRQFTLQKLAELTGLSKPLLSQIENEQVTPPLATLLRLAKAFEIDLQDFFQQKDGAEKCILVRAGENRPGGRRGKTEELPPYTYHSLAAGKRSRHMEPFLVEFEARNWHPDLQVRHAGEEFLFLLEGELELHYRDQVMTMGPGDSVYYDSNEPHGYVARGKMRPRAVAVVYSRE